MLEAFAAQSAQLAQSSTDWTQLKAAASSGQLRMDFKVADQAAKRCEEMIATLQDHYANARNLRVTGDMGACNVGDQLFSKFNDKATGDANSLAAVIRQHQQILTDMAATYRSAGAAFRAQEESNSDSMGPAT